MILALMSLQQWIDANRLWNEETQTFDATALREALEVIAITEVKTLVLASDADLMQQFLTFAGTCINDILYVKPVPNDSEEAYTEAVRQTYRQLTPRSMVSFNSNLQRIDEFANFSFCNSGEAFKHYHAWVDSYAPVHPSKHTVVMPIGEIVKQNRPAAANVLLPIITARYPQMDKNTVISAVFTAIMDQERGPEGYIYKFKMGFMEESFFDQCMIEYFSAQLGISITIDEFNQIWQATNPNFADIQPLLDQVNARELRCAGYRFEFVAYTNRKDMRHLLEELIQNNQAYVLDNDQLMGFAGLPLSCGFIKQNTVQDMIQNLIEEKSYTQTFQLAESPKKLPKHNIYYVTSAKDMNEDLEAIGQMPGVTVLLGWDGSPVHKWVANYQMEFAQEMSSSGRRRGESMVL